MKKVILFLFFTLSSFLAFSQYIEGKVVDATTNKPIEGVHVFVKGINRGVLTNEKGNYYLKFPYKIVKSDIILFSHIAYEELEEEFSELELDLETESSDEEVSNENEVEAIQGLNVTQEQVEAALERVIEKTFADKIEAILFEKMVTVVEREIADIKDRLQKDLDQIGDV